MKHSSQRKEILQTPQPLKFAESTKPWTSIKPAKAGKDGKCLLCGLHFKISEQNTWILLKNKDTVCRLFQKVPKFE